MHRVILAGSPRANGRSAHLASELFDACIEECPDDGVSIVSVASTRVLPCTGCEACARVCDDDELPAALEEGDPLTPAPVPAESDAVRHRCVIDDDMAEVRKHLDAADELVMVSPVYFASAPAQLKALLDRLQPYYHSNLRDVARAEGRRPAVLHVVGEGGDPHGFEPLVGTVRSALAVAGFELQLVLDWTGKISASGEILDEADEYVLDFECAGEDGFEDEEPERTAPRPETSSGNAEPSAGTAPRPVRPTPDDSEHANGSPSRKDAPSKPAQRPRLSFDDKPAAGKKKAGGRGAGNGRQGGRGGAKGRRS